MKKKTTCLLALALGVIDFHAAGILKVLECHDKVVEHGIETLSFAQEVNSLFGATNVDHFISSFGSKTHPPVWNSVTYFAGRYTLALQIPVSIDYENCRLKGPTGAVFIQINETINVEISKSGIAGATERGQWKLDESAWKRLVNNKGDWSVVGVSILTNAPVKGFDEFVRQGREPIRNRKEGFDNPIRKALQASPDKTSLPEPHKDKPVTNRAGDQSNELDCYGKVVRHGVEAFSLPKEVASLFGAGNVDHFISKFGSKTQTPVWHSVTYFAGRYRLVLQVPISIDYEKCKFNGAMNSAVIQISEITSVNISKPEIAGATTEERWFLNENEWKWLVKNKGQWSVVKVPIRINAPIKGFEEYVREERRRPFRSRQEDFDNPIRKAIDALRYPGGSSGQKEQ